MEAQIVCDSTYVVKRLRARGQTVPPTKTVESLYPKREELREGKILEHPLEQYVCISSVVGDILFRVWCQCRCVY